MAFILNESDITGTLVSYIVGCESNPKVFDTAEEATEELKGRIEVLKNPGHTVEWEGPNIAYILRGAGSAIKRFEITEKQD